MHGFSPWRRVGRPLTTVLTAGLALLTLSCGDGRKPVFPVKGRVVDSKDQPAAHALVIFHPKEGNPDAISPTGHVKEDGSFALTTYQQDDGAIPGDYIITIIWQKPKQHPFDKQSPDELEGRYADPKTSRLSFKVENRAVNEVPPIQVQ